MIDPNQAYNDPALAQASSEASAAGSTASAYTTAASTLPYKLKQAVLEKLNYNKDLIEQQNKSMADYFAAPAQARDKYSNIWDPTKREALVATSRAQAYEPYANTTDILNARMGTVNDIIGAGTAAYGAQVQGAQNDWQQKQQQYNNLLAIIDKKAENNKWAYEQTHAKPSSVAKDTTLDDLMSLAEKFGIDFGNNGNKEQKIIEPLGPSRPGQKLEYPTGTGVIWEGDGQGGWK